MHTPIHPYAGSTCIHACRQKLALAGVAVIYTSNLVNAHIGVDDIVLRHMYLIHTGIAVCLPLPFPLSSPLSPSSRHPFPLSLSSPPLQGLLHLILNKLFPCCLHHHCLQILYTTNFLICRTFFNILTEIQNLINSWPLPPFLLPPSPLTPPSPLP